MVGLERKLLYTCMLLLLIPFLYPPVSTTLKSYLTSVVNFYDRLFEQFAGPAHSRDTEQSEALQNKNTDKNSSSLKEQQSNVESQATTKEISEGVQPSENRSESVSELAKEPIALKDFKLIIPFDYNSNEVPETAYADLNRAAVVAHQNLNVTIVVRGYTDDRGSDSYNQQLSEFRANIVKSYLVGQGVSPKRIKVVGMGEESPIESNMTEEGRRVNRRVEVELVAE